MTADHPVLIGGRWITTQETLADRNPAHASEVVAQFPVLNRSEVEEALDAAAAALPAWREVPVIERGLHLAAAAQLLNQERETVAQDVTREQGKPLREALREVDKTVDCLNYYAGLGRGAQGTVLPDARPHAVSWTTREPLGVVACITPWNVPLAIPGRKLAPALLSGDTVVLKPASLTPLAAWHLVRILNTVGIPPGVINLVTAPASTVTEAVLAHPAMRGIAFTGSSEVGQTLIREGTSRGLLVQAEMGGKNALVVLDDADLDIAAKLAVAAGFSLSGQQCTAASRVLVAAAVYDSFRERFLAAVRALRVGDGMDPGVHMGPVVDGHQLESVLSAIDTGRAEGARLLNGGGRLDREDCRDGFFISPTVFEVESPTMRVATEEIFGPVVALLRVRDLDEAIAISNSTRFGLSASICTRDLGAAYRFIREAEAGLVGVNVSTAGWDVQLPFGGVRASGFHFKDHGEEALEFYTRLKSVVVQPTM